MKAMKWIRSAVVATAILVPLQSASAWGGGHYGGGGYEESHRPYYGRGDDEGYRGHYRDHYHRRYGDYRWHRHPHGGPGYYGRPWFGYRGPVVVVPLPPLPPPPRPW